MNSFPYTNPYTQPKAPEKVSDLLQQLETASPDHLLPLLQQAHGLVAINNNKDSSSLDWDLSTCTRLVDWVLQFIRNNNNRDTGVLAVILQLLAKCIDSWNDRFVYAAAVHQYDEDTTQETLLTVLEHLTLHSINNTNKQSTHTEAVPLEVPSALAALVCIWETLDRLHQVTNPSLSLNAEETTSWWIPDTEKRTEWQAVISLALRYWTTSSQEQQQQMSQQHHQRPEEVKTTLASFLAQLLRYQQDDWIFSCTKQALDTVQHSLSTEASRLGDCNMPVSAYTKLSLFSWQLLVALKKARGETSGLSSLGGVQQADLLDPLLYAAFGEDDENNNHGQHRWTRAVQHSSWPIAQWAQGVLYTMCKCFSSKRSPQQVVSTQQQARILKRAETAWTALLTWVQQQSNTPMDESVLRLLFLCYSLFPSIARTALQNVLSLQKKDPTLDSMDDSTGYQTAFCNAGTIPGALLRLVRTQDSLWAAGLLLNLLQDRRRRIHHDALSRALWDTSSSIDHRFVSHCMELLVSSSRQMQHCISSSDYHCPKTLCLLELLLLVVTMEEDLCLFAMTSLSADAVEAFVSIQSPKQTRMEIATGDTNTRHRTSFIANSNVNGNVSRLVDAEDDTPPANNLSRLEETSIFVDEAQLPRGMDAMVRLSAATILATLSSSSSSCSAKHDDQVNQVLQQRMVHAVQSYLADTQFSLVATTTNAAQSSLGLTRRRLRLFTALASDPENEEFLASSLHATECSQKQMAESGRTKLARCTRELKECRQRERTLQAEKEACELKLSLQVARFEREKSDLRAKFAFESKQQVDIHWTERTKAERTARELSTRCQTAEAKLEQVERQAESAKGAEQELRSSLEVYKQKAQDLESRQADMSERVQTSERELKQVSEELRAVKATYKKSSANEKGLQERLDDQEQALEEAEDTEAAMRDSLENLFADMVSLSQLYELKEKEAASAKDHEVGLVDELKRKLKHQTKQMAELEEQVKQILYENEVLSNKCARAKEKLEQERKERQRDVERRKRSGPVSYINQLHQSTASERSSKSSRRDKENETQATERTSKSSRSRRDRTTESQSFRSAASSQHRSRSGYR